MWFILAMASTILATIRRTGEKKVLGNISPFALGWNVQLTSLPIIALAMFASGQWIDPMAAGGKFWWPILFDALVFYPLNTWLFYTAIHTGKLSSVLPVQSIGPLLSTLFAALILRQIPSAITLSALGVICLGLYALTEPKGKLLPRRGDRSTTLPLLCMLGSTVLVAVANPIETIAIRTASPLYYAFFSTVVASVTLFIAARVTRQGTPRDHLVALVGIGVLQSLSYMSVVVALDTGPIAYISAIKSMSLPLGVLAGIFFFGEKFTHRKFWAIFLITGGLIGLAFG